jgi:4-hydroxy-tetrahydrodipicolinate reductase
MSAIRVHVHGARGRMGSACVEAIAGAADMQLVGTSGRGDDLHEALRASRPEVAVEFTVAEAAADHLRVMLESDCHVVSGTTGLPAAQARALGELARARGRGLLLAPNFALGMLLLQRFARQAAAWMHDVEIVELHHERKRDAPSGTALHTARLIAEAARTALNQGRPDTAELRAGARGGIEEGVPIHSIRLPGLLAHQEVLFGAPGQVLTLRHDALDRRAYLPGVLLGIRRIRSRTGLVDSLDSMLDDGPVLE